MDEMTEDTEETTKEENIGTMIKQIIETTNGLKDSNLKNDSKRLIGMLLSDNVGFETIMDGIASKIAKAQTTHHDDLIYNARYTVRYWKYIQRLIVDTQKLNTEQVESEEEFNG